MTGKKSSQRGTWQALSMLTIREKEQTNRLSRQDRRLWRNASTNTWLVHQKSTLTHVSPETSPRGELSRKRSKPKQLTCISSGDVKFSKSMRGRPELHLTVPLEQDKSNRTCLNQSVRPRICKTSGMMEWKQLAMQQESKSRKSKKSRESSSKDVTITSSGTSQSTVSHPTLHSSEVLIRLLQAVADQDHQGQVHQGLRNALEVQRDQVALEPSRWWIRTRIELVHDLESLYYLYSTLN